MRPKPDAFLERNRVPTGPLGSDARFGNNGAFLLECPRTMRWLKVLASDGAGWDHVSVSPLDENGPTPTWEEMCWVKDLFWDPEEVVIQYHPARSEYRNLHPKCLHLWRPQQADLPRPRPVFGAPDGTAEETAELNDWQRRLRQEVRR